MVAVLSPRPPTAAATSAAAAVAAASATTVPAAASAATVVVFIVRIGYCCCGFHCACRLFSSAAVAAAVSITTVFGITIIAASRYHFPRSLESLAYGIASIPPCSFPIASAPGRAADTAHPASPLVLQVRARIVGGGQCIRVRSRAVRCAPELRHRVVGTADGRRHMHVPVRCADRCVGLTAAATAPLSNRGPARRAATSRAPYAAATSATHRWATTASRSRSPAPERSRTSFVAQGIGRCVMRSPAARPAQNPRYAPRCRAARGRIDNAAATGRRVGHPLHRHWLVGAAAAADPRARRKHEHRRRRLREPGVRAQRAPVAELRRV